jgi:hypothetical protein
MLAKSRVFRIEDAVCTLIVDLQRWSCVSQHVPPIVLVIFA